MDVLEWRQKTPLIEYSPFDDLYDKLAAINGIEDITHFLNPTKEDLHDPYLLKNLDVAIHRIIRAIKQDEHISIFLDVDADGITSGAIMYKYIKHYTDNVTYFHGQRSLGHGLHTVMDKIPEGTQLLIAVDSSSSNDRECKQLKEKNIDVVVIDHHPLENPNEHCILVNPQQEGCNYPNKELSGAALCWKVCSVLDDYNEFGVRYSEELIDLAMVGLVSDMMDMTEMENRAIVSLGLSNIKNIGIQLLLKSKGKKSDYANTTDIAFNVSPFLNAAARQNKIEKAVELLATDDPDRCKQLVKELTSLNKERKTKQALHIEDFKDRINENDKIIVLIEPTVGKSFAGLIANDIAQKYKRPCLLISKEDDGRDIYSGSYRTYGGFDLKSYFESLPEVFMTGGHPGAGGVSVKEANLKSFLVSVQDNLNDVEFEQVIEYDLEIEADEITEDYIRKVNRFYKISGKNFPEARFLIEGLTVMDKVLIGKEIKETVKIDCDHVQLMKFKTNEDFLNSVPVYTNIKALGTLNINVFYHWGLKKAVKTNQVLLDDIKV